MNPRDGAGRSGGGLSANARTAGTQLGEAFESLAVAARRYPFAVALLAVGAGWLAHDLVQRRSRRLAGAPDWSRRMRRAERIPVLNTGQARIYHPDRSSLHPTQDRLESRREMSARV